MRQLFVLLAVFCGNVAAQQSMPSVDSSPPLIDFWYGDVQNVPGATVAQDWVNVLGRVGDPQSDVVALSFSLFHGASDRPSLAGFVNIGPHPIRVPLRTPFGPRRLYRTGDFNIDIPKSSLVDGDNRVLVTAFNGAGLAASTRVTLQYDAAETVTLPLEINWPAQERLDERVQVVDGRWTRTDGGVRVAEAGYDRLLALGSTEWRDFDVRIPVTFNAIEPGTRLPASGPDDLGSFCIVSRWVGHTDNPSRCDQPKCGWLPAGGTLCAVIERNRTIHFNLTVPGSEAQGLRTRSIPYRDGAAYRMRLRARSQEGGGSRYDARLWPADGEEPGTWTMTVTTDADPIAGGALALRAHHLDVTIGDVEVSEPGNDPGNP